MLLATHFYFGVRKGVVIVPTAPKLYKSFGFCLITSFHSFDEEAEKYFLIVFWSDTKFAPFEFKNLCFTEPMRNIHRGATLGHSEDEPHWGYSAAGGREMWLQSCPNLWVCKPLAAGKEIEWSSSAEIFTGWILFCSVMVWPRVTRFRHCPVGKQFLVNVGSIFGNEPISCNEPVIDLFFLQVSDKWLTSHQNYELLIDEITHSD